MTKLYQLMKSDHHQKADEFDTELHIESKASLPKNLTKELPLNN